MTGKTDILISNFKNSLQFFPFKNIENLITFNFQIRKKQQDKENKPCKEAENEDIDEGVQSIKKSVVPIRCISNLMTGANGLSGNYQSFDNTYQKSNQKNNPNLINSEKFTICLSSPTQENSKKLTTKVSQVSIESKISKPQALSFQESQQIPKKQSAKPAQRVVQLTINPGNEQTQCFTQDDHNISSSCEDIQNTPPRIKLKISQLASKNKFNNGENKVTIDLSCKNDVQLTSKSQNNKMFNHQSSYVEQRKRENSTLRSSQEYDQLNQRKERLDNILKKSFEIMNTLRSSTDQLSQLKPINRMAIRINSTERPMGLLSAKNTNVQSSFSHQAHQALICSKSPQQKIDTKQLHSTVNEFQIDHSKTMDNRIHTSVKQRQIQIDRKITDLREARMRNRSQSNRHQDINSRENPQIIDDTQGGFSEYQKFEDNRSLQSKRHELKKNRSGIIGSDLEEKFNELDSLFKQQSVTNLNTKRDILQNMVPISNGNIKEQILAKCIKSNNFKIMNQNDYDGNFPNLWTNQILNKNLGHIENDQNVLERPRSITFESSKEKQSSSIIRNQIREQINNKKFQKWDELASIIKQNSSPRQKTIFMNGSQNVQNAQYTPLEDKSFNKQYYVKHNKIDLSQTLNNFNSLKPPVNFKKRRPEDEFCYNDKQLEEQLARGMNSARTRSGSQYLPGFEGGSCRQVQIRTPREYIPSQLSIHSPEMTSFVSNGDFKRPDLKMYSSQNQYQAKIEKSKAILINKNVGEVDFPLNMIKSNNISTSADFSKGIFSGIASPQYEPIGKREKARPEVTELIERQRSRINSQNTRKEQNQPNIIINVQEMQRKGSTLMANTYKK